MKEDNNDYVADIAYIALTLRKCHEDMKSAYAEINWNAVPTEQEDPKSYWREVIESLNSMADKFERIASQTEERPATATTL